MYRQGRKIIVTAALCCLAAAVAGCLPRGGARIEARDYVSHYLTSQRALGGISRVVLVEPADQSRHPRVARAVTTALYKEMQARGIFHVDLVWRSDPICRDLPLDKREAYLLEDLADIRNELRCDAILFGRITEFASYPRMQIGLYLRLLDLKQGRLIWAVDHIWSMDDKVVRARSERFVREEKPGAYGPMDSEILRMSPTAFAGFVAFETAETLWPAGKPAKSAESQ